jgi:hypothetical protein
MATETELAEQHDKAEAFLAAQRLPVERDDVDHRVLGLVIHGIGQQSSGSTLRHVVQALYPLIRARLDSKASLAIKPLDEGDPAEGQIWFTPQATGDEGATTSNLWNRWDRSVKQREPPA